MTEKNSRSVLMCQFWLLGYLCGLRCLFVFLSECRLFHLSKLILLPCIPAAFISVAPECFVQLSSTLYCYLQICPEGQCETEAWIMVSELYLFARTMHFYKKFYYWLLANISPLLMETIILKHGETHSCHSSGM